MSFYAAEFAAEAQARFDGRRWCSVCEKRWNAMDGRLIGCLPSHDPQPAPRPPVVEPRIRRRDPWERYSIEEKVKRAAQAAKRSER